MNLQINNNLFAVSIYIKLPLIKINEERTEKIISVLFIDTTCIFTLWKHPLNKGFICYNKTSIKCDLMCINRNGVNPMV